MFNEKLSEANFLDSSKAKGSNIFHYSYFPLLEKPKIPYIVRDIMIITLTLNEFTLIVKKLQLIYYCFNYKKKKKKKSFK